MIQKPRRRVRKAAKVDASLKVSYKNVAQLKRYITEQGAILSREETGFSQKQQRQLSTAVKRARHLALLPFTQTL
jgi:small subunit ribosomal protein S18